MAWGGDQAGSWSGVAARGFLASYATRVVLHSVIKLFGAPLTPGVFWAVEALMLTGASAILLVRWRKGAVRVPFGPMRRVALIVVLPVVVTLVLLPQIFWQDFTEDGLEALEAGRSLSHYVVPRFPNDSGFMGLGIGMLSMAPPVSWFIQLLGPVNGNRKLHTFGN